MVLKKRTRKNRLSAFLFFFVILSLPAAGIWIYTSLKTYRVLNATLETDTRTMAEEIKGIVHREILSYSRLVLFIAESTKYVLEDNSSDLHYLEGLYARLLRMNSHFYQVRFINVEGMEQIRFDLRDGEPLMRPSDQLQDKSHRYYFNQTMELEPGGIYLSPIDLNIENGEIEDPWRPTIRIGTPLYSKTGAPLGMVIMNIELDTLLAAFTIQNETMLYLLNDEGFLLGGEGDPRLWGFMFQKDNSLSDTDPELWKSITSMKKGVFTKNFNIYGFSTINSDSFKVENLKIVSPCWIILAERERTDGFFTYIWNPLIIGLSLIILAALSYFLTVLMMLKRQNASYAKEIETTRIQTEKLRFLGKIIASIAHELNTPIGTSLNFVGNIRYETGEFHKLIEDSRISRQEIDDYMVSMSTQSELMEKSLNHAAGLIKRFKNVSVDQTSERLREFYLPDYIEDILETIRPGYKHTPVEFEVICPQRVKIISYPGGLFQVITNLIQNAVIHGLPDRKRPKIRITVERMKKHLEIRVFDNGKGINPENLDKIFDPFFTTRQNLGGSGLGLHIAFSIVSNLLGGSLSVRSRLNQFTEFIMKIPFDITRKENYDESN